MHTIAPTQGRIALLCATAGIVFLFPWKQPLPAAAVSVFVFGFVQIVFPHCRPIAEKPLCPWNWALLLFALKLVVLRAAEVIGGVEIGELPHLPSTRSINLALLLESLAYICFAATYNGLQARRRAGAISYPLRWYIPGWLILLCFLIGTIGAWLFFGSLDVLTAYFRNPAEYMVLQINEALARAGPIAISTSLRPFLGSSLVLLVCRLLDRPHVLSKFGSGLLTAALIFLTAVSFSIFSYNRGAFVAPVLALCAVALSRLRTQTWKVTGAAVLVLALLLAMTTIFRSTHGQTDFASSLGEWRRAAGELELSSLVQVYGNGPQFLGFLLEETEGRELQWGRGLVAGILSPLPILGKDFRSSSGTALYNQLFNRGDAEDQVISFVGELFLNFHVPGIVLGFALLGGLLSWLQNAFLRAESALPIYVIQLTAIWLLFLMVGSVSVVSQIAIYFYGPIYLYLFLPKRVRSAPQLCPGVGASTRTASFC
jgi:hypothetical protein